MRQRSILHLSRFIIVGSGGAIWACLPELWRALPLKRLTIKRFQSTRLTSRPTGQLPACRPKRGGGRLIGRTKGGMNTKLHAVTDTVGRPIRFFMTAGQASDYTGARALVSSLPSADWLLGDRGYDADWFREALVDMGITPCIPGRKSRGKAVKYDKRRY